MGKRVLFFRPRKSTDFNPVPQLGLGIFTRLLRQAGHEVAVCDHLLYLNREAPSVEELVESFRPDVVGVTIFTSTASPGRNIIRRVRALRPDVPILAGGPHVSIYIDSLLAEPDVDYLVTGEADDEIVRLVETAARQARPRVVRSAAPEMLHTAWPDFTSFHGIEGIEQYPIQTGRGCPFKCNFCAVPIVSTKKWRRRDPADCVAEIEAAMQVLPGLKSVKVVDDVPTINLKHFKEFLRAYLAAKIPLPMHIDNVRADEVDAEFLSLARQAGVRRVCLAVEHGHPEVLKLVDKGESHEDMVRAAALIHAEGLELECCFVIGLPLDSLERTQASIDFARKLGARHIFWNMAHPMPGTTMHRWFAERGARFYPDEDYTSFDFHTLRCPDPVLETADFTRLDRRKAYMMAVMATDQFELRRDLPDFVRGVFRYGLYGEGARAVGRRFARRLRLLRGQPEAPASSWQMGAPVETRERALPGNGRSF